MFLNLFIRSLSHLKIIKMILGITSMQMHYSQINALQYLILHTYLNKFMHIHDIPREIEMFALDVLSLCQDQDFL